MMTTIQITATIIRSCSLVLSVQKNINAHLFQPHGIVCPQSVFEEYCVDMCH